MNQILTLKVGSSQIARLGLSLAAFMIFGAFPAQGQQGGSLADAARQARAQKQGTDTNQAQQIADELSEDQNDTGAPGGFKTYNAGDYQLWVPAPYHVDGHDDAGVVLSGPAVGVKHPIVLVGTPIVVHWQNSDDDAFAETVAKFSHLYAQTVSCTKTTIAKHSAYQCNLAGGTLLGTHVSGNAAFVLGAGNIYPVFCTSPSDSRNRDFINDQRWRGSKDWSVQQLAHEEDDSRAVFQKCDTVFQSIVLKPQATQPQTAQTQAVQTQTVQAKTNAPQAQVATTQIASSSTAISSSSANASPTASQNAVAAAQTAPPSSNNPASSTVPAGFKVHAFNYCKSHNDCWNASVLVPADAQLVSSTCKQYIFESKVQGTTFLLMAGLAKADCDGNGSGPDPVRWNQLADPENKRAPGTYSTISSLNTSLDGKPAIITTMSFRKGLDSWMGKRAEIESNGIPLVVGCIAPREHFADGDAICSSLIGSLQLP